MSPRTHLRTPCREKERNARCDGGMLTRSYSERDSGFQRTKNVPPRRDELSSISCPTQWTPCHRARTSAFCRARRKWDLPPSESLLPVARLVTETSERPCSLHSLRIKLPFAQRCTPPRVVRCMLSWGTRSPLPQTPYGVNSRASTALGSFMR